MNGIRCIIGLGNPGEKYVKTRHNAGVWFVDYLAERYHASFKLDKKLHGFIAEFSQNNQKIFLFKPTTYMNESGRAVNAFAQFYKIKPEEMLVAHDELDFEAGIVRLKKAGGHGGHNGLRDMIACLNSAEFLRLRIGIGHPGHRDQVSDYVLTMPSRDDFAKNTQSIEEAEKVISDLISGDIQKAFNKLHSAI